MVMACSVWYRSEEFCSVFLDVNGITPDGMHPTLSCTRQIRVSKIGTGQYLRIFIISDS